MAEFYGAPHLVELQKSLRDRAAKIAQDPLLSNGGRILNILDPDAFGWDRVFALADRDRFVGLTRVDRDRTLARLRARYGTQAEFPYWSAFEGTPDVTGPACDRILDGADLPRGWTCSSTDRPDAATVEASQILNEATGVAPAPAYFLRGDAVPSMLTLLHDADGTLVGCASGTMRYHPDGPLGGWLFAGSVSVAPEHRGRGLGAVLNARLLRDSQARFGWRAVLEQARADNLGSVGMITKCGLTGTPGQVTMLINLTGAFITR